MAAVHLRVTEQKKYTEKKNATSRPAACVASSDCLQGHGSLQPLSNSLTPAVDAGSSQYNRMESVRILTSTLKIY